MNKPEFIVTPGAGERFRQELHFSAAVGIGSRVETSGQGGWNGDLQIPQSIKEEIIAAFGNIERVLTAAGATCATRRSPPRGPHLRPRRRRASG